MGSLGFQEMLIIGIIALLFFGPKKLPELGSGLGKAIRDFKSALGGLSEHEEQTPPKQVSAASLPAPSEQPGMEVKSTTEVTKGT